MPQVPDHMKSELSLEAKMMKLRFARKDNEEGKGEASRKKQRPQYKTD